ncbi:MAG: hypothetical protein FWD94_06915 [Treponema sp.]|nr:hypothetical protein [Treponema sp.]
MVLCYALVPAVGALSRRRLWYGFRNRFNRMRLLPVLQSRDYWKLADMPEGRPFRFQGELEAASEDRLLWVRGRGFSVPVSLKNAETYLVPMQGGESGTGEIAEPGESQAEKIRPERSALAEGTKVFVGGQLARIEGRWTFASSRTLPLMVIFHDGQESSLAANAIWAGRQRGEYLNRLTPYSLVFGTLCLLSMASYFLPRPAFRPAVLASLVAIFVPLLPLVPPGLLCTIAYRSLTWRARILRAYADLARLPVQYLLRRPSDLGSFGTLPDGERYGFVRTRLMPPEVADGRIPLLIPEMPRKTATDWYVFGTLKGRGDLPDRPSDPLSTFGAIPGNPLRYAGASTVKAYILEGLGLLILLVGIAGNLFLLGLAVPVLLR